MVMENNKYFNIRKDEEKNILACNLLAWIVLMVLSIIRVVKVRAEKMDDEMDEAFRKLNEKRKDETKLWQGEDQE